MDYSKLIKEINYEQMRKDLPNFSAGDTIRINVKIKEDKKYRIQAFEGVVIKKQGSDISSSVTVRKTTAGVAVERTLPLHSPIIDSIEVIKRGRVRRAKIYYIRNLSGKAARIKEKLPTVHHQTQNSKKAKDEKNVKSKTASKNLINYQRARRKALDKKKALSLNPKKQLKKPTAIEQTPAVKVEKKVSKQAKSKTVKKIVKK